MENKDTREIKGNEAPTLSEALYYGMIAEVEDYAIILLDREGNIQNWNRGAQKIKGYTEKEILGKNFSIFYLPEDKAADLPGTLKKKAEQEGRAIHEGWRMRKDGTRFWGSITITALHNHTGDVVGFSKVTRDLTAKKEAEDRLMQYAATLEKQNKELEQFAYITSHDLQEPLRKIRTFADIIKQNLDDEAVVQTYLEKLDVSSARMSDLIKSILNYSRLSKGSPDHYPVNLNHTIDQVKIDFEITIAEKNAQINYQGLPTLNGHEQQLSQLFSNLIGNALKFTLRSPILFIRSQRKRRDEITSSPIDLTEEYYCEIVVEDNGIGFEPKFEKQIFGMFQRLHNKQKYPGTGIGLSICKRIMEYHHGFITAQSQPDKGSLFSLFFPETKVIKW